MEKNNTTEKKVNKKLNVKNKKKFVITIICIIAIVLILALILITVIKPGVKVIKTATNEIDMTNTENVEVIDGKKVNNSEEMKMEQHVDRLTCEVVELTADSNESKLVMNVRNNGEEFAGSKATIVFFEKEGRIYGELDTYIGKIAAGETINLELTTTLDVTNAHSYSVELAK